MAKATLSQNAQRFVKMKYVALSAVGIASLAVAPQATAQSQAGAPITFAGASSQYTQYASAPVQSTRVQGGGKRVEFRYPDQPNMSYGANGATRLSAGAQPMAFSSSKSAVTLEQAQKISGATYIPPRDPALTVGAFDARATAAKVASKVGRSAKQTASNISHKVAAKVSQKMRMPTSKQVRARGVTLASAPPKGFAKQKIGAPYEVAGRWYVPFAEPNYDEVGVGSWYGPQFHGKLSAVGEVFDQDALTAAHPTLPIPSLARVTNLENGRSIVVRINDRGPFVDDRIIDLSKQSATVLGYKDNGTAKVRVQYMGFAPEAHNTVPAKYVEEARRTLAKGRSSQRSAPLMKASYKTENPVKRMLAALPQSPRRVVSQNEFVLQAGVFGDLGNAHALRAKLHDYGRVSVKEVRINGRDLFKVYVGNWSSRQQASKVKSQLAGRGFETMIVSN